MRLAHGERGWRSYSRILSKSWRRLMPRRSAVLVRLPPQASRARWIARRSTSASRARSGSGSAGSPAAGIGGSAGSSASRCSGRMARPRAAIAARARAFSSCRTLPGQGRSRMAARASGESESSPQPCLRSSAAEDVLGQGRDVLGAVAERRDDDPGDVEAIVQVLAEPAGGDLLGQVAVRGRDDAGVGAEGLGPADALELALLEDAEDLGLGRQRAARPPRRGRSCRRRRARTGRASGGRRR